MKRDHLSYAAPGKLIEKTVCEKTITASAAGKLFTPRERKECGES